MRTPLLLAVLLCAVCNAYAVDSGEGWPVWGGDAGGTRFSPLDQITPANVTGLEVAWE